MIKLLERFVNWAGRNLEKEPQTSTVSRKSLPVVVEPPAESSIRCIYCNANHYSSWCKEW